MPGKAKSATLFYLLSPVFINLDKARKLGHSPAEVKFCNACVGKLNAGASFVDVLKCSHHAGNQRAKAAVHHCMNTCEHARISHDCMMKTVPWRVSMPSIPKKEKARCSAEGAAVTKRTFDLFKFG